MGRAIFCPFSKEWIWQVNSCIKNGFGIEDTALKMECSAESVRRHVCALRKDGTLNYWFRR